MLLVVDIAVVYEKFTHMSTESSPLASRHQSLETLFAAMYHGKWRFADFAGAPVEANTVSKTFNQSGRIRQILIASEKLKAWHEFIRLFLLDFVPINKDIVFSYRKGMSAYDAVKRHAASKSFYVCDLADFFPSIRQARIRATLLTAKGLCPIEDFEAWLDRIVDLVCVNDSLPIGFSTSPPISNATLVPFDNALQDYCNSNGLVLTRYSDDIIVSTQDAGALQGIQNQVALLLQDSMAGEFSLNTRKSRLLNRGNKIKLLGMVLLPNGSVSVDSSVKDQVEVLIHFYLRDKNKFAEMMGGDARKTEARLSGLLNYVNTIDQAYLDKLRKKFGVAVVDYFLHRSFS
jgi:RNA-directed DNA polymerase